MAMLRQFLAGGFRFQITQYLPGDHRIFDTGTNLHRPFALLAFVDVDVDAENPFLPSGQVIEACSSLAGDGKHKVRI